MINRFFANFEQMPSLPILGLILLLALVARTIFGICFDFWTDDELQIFLLGFKFYTTHKWPYFGPDVVYDFGQIPGALQALLIGLPLFVFAGIEAPYILLNVLSFGGLLFLFGYTRRLLPDVPWWVLLFWLLIAPWTVHFGTHIFNPSYVLLASCLFFVSFFECIPIMSTQWISKNLAFFLMGFSLFWVFQLHMSYVVLVPFIAYAGFKHFQATNVKSLIVVLFWFGFGCMVTGALVVPTFIEYGLGAKGMGGSTKNIVFNPHHAFEFGTIVIRFFSFASFEFNRFIGLSTNEKIEVLTTYWWAAPSIVFVALTGFVQVGFMIVQYLRWKKSDTKRNFLKLLILTSFLTLTIMFMFSIKEPAAHTFYVLMPVAMIYYFMVLQDVLTFSWMRPLLLIFYISGILFHISIDMKKFNKNSYAIKLDAVREAFEKKDYTILGKRRSDIYGCCY